MCLCTLCCITPFSACLATQWSCVIAISCATAIKRVAMIPHALPRHVRRRLPLLQGCTSRYCAPTQHTIADPPRSSQTRVLCRPSGRLCRSSRCLLCLLWLAGGVGSSEVGGASGGGGLAGGEGHARRVAAGTHLDNCLQHDSQLWVGVLWRHATFRSEAQTQARDNIWTC